MDKGIKPKYTFVRQIEFGYLLTDNISIYGNIFYTKIDNTILYCYKVPPNI